MPDFDNSKLRYWESSENLREHLSDIFQREVPLKIANQISNHLTQGRLYFESATNSSYEIRPVLIFYGMVGFSKALVLARTHCDECTFPHKHGLTDVSSDNSKLKNLEIKIEESGNFQLFNDAARIKKVRLLENSLWKYYFCPSSPSENLKTKKLTLQEILSRIPNLEVLYKDTFGKDPNLVRCSWPGVDQFTDYIDFQIFHHKQFRNLQEINDIVKDLRERYSVLKNWFLIKANWSWDNNSLTWANIRPNDENMALEQYLELEKDEYWGKEKNGFKAKKEALEGERIEFSEIIPPMADVGNPYLIEEYDGEDISEASLYYMGVFLLSSLVRYRPNTWIHSLKGRNTDIHPIDDKPLAIILKFLDLSLNKFPEMILDFIKEPPHKEIGHDL